ncbi:hypothetical protein [Vibrio crassostreae]|uniref:hypothetical protein n=1 Tax=Vibrio crassostreae TaxID=246167 RepID=UPI001B31081F|nr:hypothetical protein [Vibrio crassostreae]
MDNELFFLTLTVAADGTAIHHFHNKNGTVMSSKRDNIKTAVLQWFFTYLATVALFYAYAISPLNGYALAEYKDSVVLSTSLLMGYQISFFTFYSFVKGRVETRGLIPSAIVAIVLWHFSFFGKLELMAIEQLLGGWDGLDPEQKVFDKQAPAAYFFIISLIGAMVVGFKRRATDLKILSVIGWVILVITAWYHVFSYWSIMRVSEVHTLEADKPMVNLAQLGDKSFNMYCDMMKGSEVDCFRFDVKDGAPDALKNYIIGYNSEIRDAISEYKRDLETSETYVTRTGYLRDKMFDDTHSQFYSKAIAFDMRDGRVTYIISNYQNDIQIIFLSGLSVIIFWVMLLWFGVFGAIAIAHRKPESKGKKPEWFKMFAYFFAVFATALSFSLLDLEIFLRSYPVVLLLLLVALARWVYKHRIYNFVKFMILMFIFFAIPFIYYIVNLFGIIDSLKSGSQVFDIAVGAFSLCVSLIVIFKVVISAMGKAVEVPQEQGFYINLLSSLIVLFGVTVIGLVFSFYVPDLMMEIENARLTSMYAAEGLSPDTIGMICSDLPLDACQTVNNPDWKLDMYQPVFNSMWLMLGTGVLSISFVTNFVFRSIHAR